MDERDYASIMANPSNPGANAGANSGGTTRRHFFYGSLLAAAVPAAGFGSTPSLKHMGYKSPNEKLNIAAIGAGGKGRSDIARLQGGEHRRPRRPGR